MCMQGWSKSAANAGYLGADKVYDPTNDAAFAAMKKGSPDAKVTISVPYAKAAADEAGFKFAFSKDMAGTMGASVLDIKVTEVNAALPDTLVKFTCMGPSGGAKVGSIASTGDKGMMSFKALSEKMGAPVKALTALLQKKPEVEDNSNSTNGTVELQRLLTAPRLSPSLAKPAPTAPTAL